MTDNTDTNDENAEGWSTGAKVSAAAVGSAAIMAALLFANKKRKDAQPKPKVTAKLLPKGPVKAKAKTKKAAASKTGAATKTVRTPRATKSTRTKAASPKKP